MRSAQIVSLSGSFSKLYIGNYQWRLVAKAVARTVSQVVAEVLELKQTVFGILQCYEAASPATQAFVARMTDEKVLIFQDFKNALNPVGRDAELYPVRLHISLPDTCVHSCCS